MINAFEVLKSSLALSRPLVLLLIVLLVSRINSELIRIATGCFCGIANAIAIELLYIKHGVTAVTILRQIQSTARH